MRYPATIILLLINLSSVLQLILRSWYRRGLVINTSLLREVITMFLELFWFLIDLAQFILYLIEKFKEKQKNNNRCPEQVTVIIIFIE